jgi:hypothetical protein
MSSPPLEPRPQGEVQAGTVGRGFWPSRLWTAAAFAVAGTALTFLGCVSFPLDGPSVSESASARAVLMQEGEVVVPARSEQVVYYPVPYASPPNLELDADLADLFRRCEVVEQRPDRFRVRNPTLFPHTIGWTARGVRCAPAFVAPLPPRGMPVPIPPGTTPKAGQLGQPAPTR